MPPKSWYGSLTEKLREKNETQPGDRMEPVFRHTNYKAPCHDLLIQIIHNSLELPTRIITGQNTLISGFQIKSSIFSIQYFDEVLFQNKRKHSNSF